jgi:hypothetical protein
MFRRNLFVSAAVLASVAVLLSFIFSKQDTAPQQIHRPKGRNNTVLFLSNSEYGLANVLLATAYALLVHHGDIQVHFASFPKRKADIARISKSARDQSRDASVMKFHELAGPTLGDALNSRGHFVAETIHEPGLVGAAKLCRDIQKYLMPWSGPDYFTLYEQILRIIDEVDPAVIALDPQFGPALDATKDKNQSHAIVSPNSLRDNFAQFQPWGGMFWKYPA